MQTKPLLKNKDVNTEQRIAASILRPYAPEASRQFGVPSCLKPVLDTSNAELWISCCFVEGDEQAGYVVEDEALSAAVEEAGRIQIVGTATDDTVISIGREQGVLLLPFPRLSVRLSRLSFPPPIPKIFTLT